MAVTGTDLADFVDYEKAFDPTDVDQWQSQSTQRTKLQILDDIYQATEKKILNGIKQQRIDNMKGRQRQKTLMMEKMDLIEEKVQKRFELDASTKIVDVVDLQKKELAGQRDKINYEKMRGRFKVIINKNLAMKKRIQSFSNDPVIYYLHKNRNFIRKLQPPRDEKSTIEKVLDLETQLGDIFYQQSKDIHYAKMGIDPKNTMLVAAAPPYKAPGEESPLDLYAARNFMSSSKDRSPNVSIKNSLNSKNKTGGDSVKPKGIMINEQSSKFLEPKRPSSNIAGNAAIKILDDDDAPHQIEVDMLSITERQATEIVESQPSAYDSKKNDAGRYNDDSSQEDAQKGLAPSTPNKSKTGGVLYDEELATAEVQKSEKKSTVSVSRENSKANSLRSKKGDFLSKVEQTQKLNQSLESIHLPNINERDISFNSRNNSALNSQTQNKTTKSSRLRQISQSQSRSKQIEVNDLIEIAASEEQQPMYLDYIERQRRAIESGSRSRSYRNCTSLEPSNRSILSSQAPHQSKVSGISQYHRQVKRKFESPDREKFRYNMIYNKMHHLLNDESQRRKRQVMGSRNLNTQAKLMITQPSQYSFDFEGNYGIGELSPVPSSPLGKLSNSGKVNLPPVMSPLNAKNDSSISARNVDTINPLFEMQPAQKVTTGAAKVMEDLETIIKRKGKIHFTANTMLKVLKPEDEEDLLLAFRKDQQLLTHLLSNCKGEEADTKLSLRALKEMNTEATMAKNKFDMVFNILDELEGVDARAIEQLFYYKINGLQEFEQEAKEVTRYHKFNQLESTGNTAKLQIQQDAIRRKQLLDKLKNRKAKK